MADAPTPIIDQTLGNDGFWPAVPVRRFIEGYRVQTSEYREELVKQVLIAAMIQTNRALREAETAAVSAGYADLEAYLAAHPDDEIADEPLAQVLYFQAVYNHAKAATTKPLAALQRRGGSANEENAANAADAYEVHFMDQHQSAVASLLDLFIPDEPHGTKHGVYVAAL
jgi:hypothetical protein